jgi:hypothetical protein
MQGLYRFEQRLFRDTPLVYDVLTVPHYFGCGSTAFQRRRTGGDGPGQGQERTMARQLLLNRGAQIEAQVKAIGHLLRLGRTVSSALGV